MWDEDEFDDEDDSGDDFELVSLDHFDVLPIQPVASASPPGPDRSRCRRRRRPGRRRAPRRFVAEGHGHPGRGRPRDGRPPAGRDRGAYCRRGDSASTRVTTSRRARPATGTAEITPGPAKIAHEVMRPPLSVPSTVAEVPRPPMIVTSTVAGADDAGSIRPDRPAPAPLAGLGGPIEPARSADEVPAGASLFDDEPMPPPAEEIATAADSAPAPSPCHRASEPSISGAPVVVDRDLSRPELATPALELPGEVRVRAGEATKLRVRVDRDGGSTPATLRFEGTPRGISVDGLAIPADVQETEVVVSAAPDAPPAVADVGVSAEVGDRRAEARVRLSVLPSAASEAYSRGRELLARGEQGPGDRGVQRGDQARSRARLGVLLPGHRRPHRRASARCAGRLHRGDPAQAGHRHRLRGPGPDSLRDGGPHQGAGGLRRGDPAQAQQRDHPRRTRPDLRRPGPVRPGPGGLQRGDPAQARERRGPLPAGQDPLLFRGTTPVRSWTSPRRSGSTRPMPGPIGIEAMPSRGWATGHAPTPIVRWSTGSPGVRPARSSSGRLSRCQLLPRRRPGRATGAGRSERPGSASPP